MTRILNLLRIECGGGSFFNQPASLPAHVTTTPGIYYSREEFVGTAIEEQQQQQQHYDDQGFVESVTLSKSAYVLPDHRVPDHCDYRLPDRHVHDESRQVPQQNFINDMLHDGKFDSFLLQLQSLLEVTNRLVNEMTVRSRLDRFHMFNAGDASNARTCNQPTTSSFSSVSTTSSSSLGRSSLFSKSYVYAVFSLVSNDERSINPSLMQHPICGHLRTDMHQVSASWYYMRRLKTNFVTSLRQKLRVNQTNFRFVGCCESTNKNISLLSALAKILKRDFPAYCFNIQGHVITMSRVKNSQLMLTNSSGDMRFVDQIHPTDSYIFNHVRQIVRLHCEKENGADVLAETTNYADFC